MPNKMLIDASHPEETRVIVTHGNKIEEFDFESDHKKQLKGNIYLARVTRVEPSLQAAFVEYGGNRHGFLAFSEIHPDYYQISDAERQALIEAESRSSDDDDDDDDESAANTAQPEKNANGNTSNGNDRSRRSHRRRGRRPFQRNDNNKVPAAEPVGPAFADYVPGTPAAALAIHSDIVKEDVKQLFNDDDEHDDNDHQHDTDDDQVESVGSEDALEELPAQRLHRRQYNIQDVIKRRQILLVQVVKEERGNKGAALTTYLSLAGRYSVLMPNTARGGGISRKITNIQDRKRLKEIVRELEVPKGMGVILRTAGANRTKAEVRRDYEYLMRLWDNVRNLTMRSSAPTLVYEEGSLIKRSIRDLYNKDISEILVAGEQGFREAKEFMRMLMPSHARVVQPYRDSVPMLSRNGIEAQLDRMLLPQVTLKSGGYIIINQTEALVAIDVNSGRSTREHSIEDTALQTNLEAAEEVARQLRLRDLAGLIVVDFIDMEEKRNNRAVEKKLKEHLKDDRARIQVGRISHFGLLEMSRQRIRASVLESTMQLCPHCAGTGHIRSDSSMALHVIRAIEDYLMRHAGYDIVVRTPVKTALYVLNHKRHLLSEMENRFGLSIHIEVDESVGTQQLMIDKGAVSTRPPAPTPVQPTDYFIDDIEDPELPTEEEIEAEVAVETTDREDKNDDNDRRRRRRRRRRNGSENSQNDQDDDSSDTVDGQQSSFDASSSENDDPRKKRRRGRRGGRKNRREDNITSHLPDAELIGDWTELLAQKAAAEQAERAAAEERKAVELAAREAVKSVPDAEPVPAPIKAVSVTVETVAIQTDAPDQPTGPADVSEETTPAKAQTKKPVRKKPVRSRKTSTATKDADAQAANEINSDSNETSSDTVETVEIAASETVVEPAKKPVRKPRARRTTTKTVKEAAAEKAETSEGVAATEAADVTENTTEATAATDNAEAAKTPAPKRNTRKTVEADADTKPTKDERAVKAENEPIITSTGSDTEEKTKRGGWWQRKGFF